MVGCFVWVVAWLVCLISWCFVTLLRGVSWFVGCLLAVQDCLVRVNSVVFSISYLFGGLVLWFCDCVWFDLLLFDLICCYVVFVVLGG